MREANILETNSMTVVTLLRDASSIPAMAHQECRWPTLLFA